MSGNTYGDTNYNGGYFGTASYLNTGKTTIKTNSNILYGATSNNQPRKDRSHGQDINSVSNIGAPMGPMKVCITDVKAGICVGDDREFPPSAYKFTLFGSYLGQDAPIQSVQNDGKEHFAFRSKLMVVGFDLSKLRVNGRAYNESKVNEDITTIDIGGGETGGLHYEFPKKYNTGSLTGSVLDGVTMAPLIETKDMHIKVHSVDLDEDEFYIDYIFEMDGIGHMGYFIYDPDVTLRQPGQGNGDSSAEGNAVSTAVSALIATVLVIATLFLA